MAQSLLTIIQPRHGDKDKEQKEGNGSASVMLSLLIGTHFMRPQQHMQRAGRGAQSRVR